MSLPVSVPLAPHLAALGVAAGTAALAAVGVAEKMVANAVVAAAAAAPRQGELV